MSTQQLKFKERVIICIAVLALLLTVPALRLATGNPLGESQETYGVITTFTDGSHWSLYGWLVTKSVDLLSFDVAVLLLPSLFALVSVVLLLALLPRIASRAKLQVYALVVTVTAPVFLHAYVGFSQYQFMITFLLLTLWLYLRLPQKYRHLAFLSAGVVCAFHPIVGIVLLVFALIYLLQEQQRLFAIELTVMGIIGLLASTYLVPLSMELTPQLNDIFSFFGADYGFSLFILLLGGYGTFLQNKETTTLFKVLRGLVLISAIFYEPLRVVAVLLLGIYSALGFGSLVRRKWVHELTGQLTVVLFICIVLFTTVVILKEQSDNFPTTAHEELALQLQSSLLTRTILTDPDYAEYYRYHGLAVFASSYTGEHLNSSQQLFNAQTLPPIAPVLDEHDINTIIIDESMRKGDIWQRPNQGLLFLLEHNAQFVRIYEKNGIEVYRRMPIS